MNMKISLLALASTVYAAPGLGQPAINDSPSVYSSDHRKLQWSQGHAWVTGLNTSTVQNPHSRPTVSRPSQTSSTSCIETDSHSTLYSTTDYDPVPSEYPSYSWTTVPPPSTPTSYVHTPDTYSTWTPDPVHESISTTIITKSWSATSVCTTFMPTSAPVYTRHGTTFYSTSLTMSYWTSKWLTSSTSIMVVPTPSCLPTDTPRSYECPVCPKYSYAAPMTVTYTVYAPSPYTLRPDAPVSYMPSPHDPSPYTPNPDVPTSSTGNPPQTMSTPSHADETYPPAIATTTVTPAQSNPPEYTPHFFPTSDVEPSTYPALPPDSTKTYRTSQWTSTGTTKPSIYPTGSNVPPAYDPGSTSHANVGTWSSPVKPTGGPRQYESNGMNGYGTSQYSQKPPQYHARAAYGDQR